MDRKTYRSRKFGSWERFQAMDAQTVPAGRGDGATFPYEIIERTAASTLKPEWRLRRLCTGVWSSYLEAVVNSRRPPEKGGSFIKGIRQLIQRKPQ